jgi:hypothetical protein
MKEPNKSIVENKGASGAGAGKVNASDSFSSK